MWGAAAARCCWVHLGIYHGCSVSWSQSQVGRAPEGFHTITLLPLPHPSLLDGHSQDIAAVRAAWCPAEFAHWLVRPQACDKGATFDCLHCVPHSLTADVALGTSHGFPNAFSLEFVH